MNDHKAAKENALDHSRACGNSCTCNLAACYLELLGLANALESALTAFPTEVVEAKEALRAVIEQGER